MKLFDVSQSVVDAVKKVMVESPACIGKAKGCTCKKCKPVTEDAAKPIRHPGDVEILDERNKENKFKKDLHVVNKAIDYDKKNLGIIPKDLNMLSKDYGHDTDTKRENMKALLKSYKKTGRYLTKNEEVETVSEVRDPGSTFGVSTPLKTKGKYVSDDGRHVAKVRHDKDYGEFRVEIHSDGVHNKNADYHTDDKEDAHDTAKAMLAHAVKLAKPLGEAVMVAGGGDENKRKEINLAKTKKAFPNVTHFTKDGHPDWKKHGNPQNEETETVIEDTLISKIINKYNNK